MVSFWPWKGEDNSPASFEKTLSTLSKRITRTNTRLDSLRQSSRRFSALWTLYTSFAYLLCLVILVLVLGWRNWGISEYLGVIGGPVIIYLVRLAVTTTYNIRISKIQARSDTLQKQRDATIEKLKAATRYNTTQELLKKYGGTPPSKERSDEKSSPKNLSTQKSSPASGQGRTGFVPPPTANIPGRNVPVSLPGTPQQVTPGLRNQNGPSSAAAAVAPWQASPPRMSPSAEFAPNAFSSAPQYAQQSHGPRWYDRLMDLVLGEDETLPRNRLALICHHCRLVNGQAPPGVQRLEDMGSWRCMGCGTMNGEEKEETKLLKQMQEHTESPKMGPRIVAEKSHTADAGSAAGSTDEDDYSLEDTENLSNTESSEGESKKHETRGAATGAQKGGNSTRRRSKRVQNKAKG